MNKFKIQNSKFLKIFLLLLFITSYQLPVTSYQLFAQEPELKFNLDVAAQTIPLPKIFKPNIDLSGRGFHRDTAWPQGLAALEVLDTWQQDMGFAGIYRLQYNLWEIHQVAKDKEAQEKLFANYENIIKRISDAGGVVILDIFGTPAGLGRVLDKRSPPVNLRAFKDLVKGYIKKLSCDKRYNIWYEVWSAPDSEDFFLGRRQEYLNLYRAVAEAIKELESETKVHIPLGGPGVSAWFQNVDGNTIITPERSLIYDLIRFCSSRRLPLDYISWHGFSTDPALEKEISIYKKPIISLMRDWLTYFKFERNTPLIVDEWNFDRGLNVSPETKEQSHISASYVLARLKNMYEAGLDYQLYFSLEDFKNIKEGVVRNTGIFWFDAESSEYKGGPKSTYNIFKMLTQLGEAMFLASTKPSDEFTGAIATKGKDYIAMLIYNYIDPDIATNFISKNIATLSPAERKFILGLIKSDKLSRIMKSELDIATLRTTKSVKGFLKKAKELNEKAAKLKGTPRNIKIGIKNLKRSDYLYQRYSVDAACGLGCKFAPQDEKEFTTSDIYEETISLNPYSVNLIILKPKPKEPEVPSGTVSPSRPLDSNAGNVTETNKE